MVGRVLVADEEGEALELVAMLLTITLEVSEKRKKYTPSMYASCGLVGMEPVLQAVGVSQPPEGIESTSCFSKRFQPSACRRSSSV